MEREKLILQNHYIVRTLSHSYSTYAWRGSGGPAKSVQARIGYWGNWGDSSVNVRMP